MNLGGHGKIFRGKVWEPCCDIKYSHRWWYELYDCYCFYIVLTVYLFRLESTFTQYTVYKVEQTARRLINTHKQQQIVVHQTYQQQMLYLATLFDHF